jgi:hypothetical protein
MCKPEEGRVSVCVVVYVFVKSKMGASGREEREEKRRCEEEENIEMEGAWEDDLFK